MTTSKANGFLALLSIALIIASFAHAREEVSTGTRTWISTSGTSVDARFIKMAYGEVHLKTADGKAIKIPESRLSEESLTMAKQLSAASKAEEGKRVPSWVKKSREAANRPPPSKALIDMFGKELVNARKKKVDLSELAAADKIGIYFSAHWCPPCRAFTPQLVKTYNALKKDGKNFEVVFVSSDRNEGGMYGYMKEAKMPWLALPFNSNQKGMLANKFRVRGIPRLVIVDADGKILSNDARGSVAGSGAGAYDKW